MPSCSRSGRQLDAIISWPEKGRSLYGDSAKIMPNKRNALQEKSPPLSNQKKQLEPSEGAFLTQRPLSFLANPEKTHMLAQYCNCQKSTRICACLDFRGIIRQSACVNTPTGFLAYRANSMREKLRDRKPL